MEITLFSLAVSVKEFVCFGCLDSWDRCLKGFYFRVTNSILEGTSVKKGRRGGSGALVIQGSIQCIEPGIKFKKKNCALNDNYW